MKTLAKRLRAAERKNKELTKEVEGLTRMNKKAEELIRNRDMELKKQRAIAVASTNFIGALAEKVGEESFILRNEDLNGRQAGYMTRMTEEGIEFRKKQTDQ